MAKRQAAAFRRTLKKRNDGPVAKADALVDVCTQCHGTVEDVVTHVQCQADITPVQPTVAKINVQVGDCLSCHVREQGTHSEHQPQITVNSNEF